MYTNENFKNKIIKTLAKAELEGGGEGVEKHRHACCRITMGKFQQKCGSLIQTRGEENMPPPHLGKLTCWFEDNVYIYF